MFLKLNTPCNSTHNPTNGDLRALQSLIPTPCEQGRSSVATLLNLSPPHMRDDLLNSILVFAATIATLAIVLAPKVVYHLWRKKAVQRHKEQICGSAKFSSGSGASRVPKVSPSLRMFGLSDDAWLREFTNARVPRSLKIQEIGDLLHLRYAALNT